MKKRILLGVNIDHVATLREARKVHYPSPVEIALIAENNGADSITAHLREDRRHVNDKDIINLKNKIKKKLNLEISTNENIIQIAEKVIPQDCCIVPENREEITTEGGLNIIKYKEKIIKCIKRLEKKNINVSLFIDPTIQAINHAITCGAKIIELNTGLYAEKFYNKFYREEELKKIKNSIDYAYSRKLIVNAGHGLNINNLKNIIQLSNNKINELNIGHSIIARSIEIGIKESIKEINKIIKETI